MKTNPEWSKASHDIVFEDPATCHIGPEPKTVKPFCGECGGAHEPSGARSDCILYWRNLAHNAIESVEWARTLLCSATPGKLLDETKSREWCAAFGKWFAESHALPVLMDDAGCAKQVCEWLQAGKYRILIHRHTGTFRAVDELKDQMIDASTVPLLADSILAWDQNAKSFQH